MTPYALAWFWLLRRPDSYVIAFTKECGIYLPANDFAEHI